MRAITGEHPMCAVTLLDWGIVRHQGCDSRRAECRYRDGGVAPEWLASRILLRGQAPIVVRSTSGQD